MPLLTTPAEPVAQVVLVVTRVLQVEAPVVLVVQLVLVRTPIPVRLAAMVTQVVVVVSAVVVSTAARAGVVVSADQTVSLLMVQLAVLVVLVVTVVLELLPVLEVLVEPVPMATPSPSTASIVLMEYLRRLAMVVLAALPVIRILSLRYQLSVVLLMDLVLEATEEMVVPVLVMLLVAPVVLAAVEV